MKITIKKLIKFANRKDVLFISGKMVDLVVFIYNHPDFARQVKAFFGL